MARIRRSLRLSARHRVHRLDLHGDHLRARDLHSRPLRAGRHAARARGRPGRARRTTATQPRIVRGVRGHHVDPADQAARRARLTASLRGHRSLSRWIHGGLSRIQRARLAGRQPGDRAPYPFCSLMPEDSPLRALSYRRPRGNPSSCNGVGRSFMSTPDHSGSSTEAETLLTGEHHALHHCGRPPSLVDPRTCHVIHDGRLYSHPHRHRHRHGPDQSHQRTPTAMTAWQTSRNSNAAQANLLWRRSA